MNLTFVCLLLFDTGNPDLSMVKNTYLLYTDVYRSKFIENHSSLSQFITPYILYTDSDRGYQNKFFDTFVLADHFTYYHSKTTSKKYWWNEYIGRVFGLDRIESMKLLHSDLDGDRAFAIQVRESCLCRLMDAVEDNILLLSFSGKAIGSKSDGKDGYVGFRFFDANKEEIRDGACDLYWSEYLDIWFKYYDVDSVWQRKTYRIDMPEGTAYVSTFIGSWLSEGIVVDNVSWESGEATLYENFEDNVRRWRFAYLPELAETDEYWGIIPVIDSLIEYYSEYSNEDLTLNIILTIPWSHQSAENRHFGMINGHSVDLSRKEEAVGAITWFIEECLANWDKLSPKNIRLVGFYWLNEEGNDFQYVDLEEIADILHQKGYLLFGSCFNNLWTKISFDSDYFRVFDCVWLQPNVWPSGFKSDDVYFERVTLSHELGGLKEDLDFVKQQGIPLSELFEIDEIADSLNAGIVIEWVPGQEEIFEYGRVIDYINIEGLYAHDFLNKRVLVFDERGFGQYCSFSSSPVFREQYDAMYYFVKKNRLLLE